MVVEYYAESGRLALAEAFPNICDNFGCVPGRSFRSIDIEVASRIVPFEELDYCHGGENVTFARRFSAPVNASIRSILTPHYATLSERYATHFRVWCFPEYRSKLFPIIEELFRNGAAACKIQQMRETHLLPLSDLEQTDPIYVEFEKYVRSTLENLAETSTECILF